MLTVVNKNPLTIMTNNGRQFRANLPLSIGWEKGDKFNVIVDDENKDCIILERLKGEE